MKPSQVLPPDEPKPRTQKPRLISELVIMFFLGVIVTVIFYKPFADTLTTLGWIKDGKTSYGQDRPGHEYKR